MTYVFNCDKFLANFNTGESNMWIAFLLGLGMIILGFASFALKKWNHNLVGVIRFILFLGVAALWGYSSFLHDQKLKNASADRKSRTTMLTGTVVKVNEERDDKWGRLFHLKIRYGQQRYEQLPYTFSDSEGCFLKNGDVVSIKFVAPEKPEGKPEILEFWNHTCRVYSYSVPEAPLTSPESPARLRSRTLPAPRAE